MEFGVGAFNARSEVVLFTDPLGGEPDGYRADGRRIEILEGGRTLHEARYGELIADGAAKRRDVTLLELGEDGRPGRSMILMKRAG